jgi:hypothetical protein
MNNSVAKVNKIIHLGLFLVKMYIATALVVWKSIGFYIAGDDGLISNFNASTWSLALGVGYVLGVVILLCHAIVQFRLKQYQGVTQTLIFAGLGLLFSLLGMDLPSLTVSFLGSLTILGLNGAMLYYSFKGLRCFKNRAFAYWLWGYSINLVSEIGTKCYTEAARHVAWNIGHAGWFQNLAQDFVWSTTPPDKCRVISSFWNLSQDFYWSAENSEWLLEFYWLGHIVSSVLVVAGLILLVRQSGLGLSRTLSINTAKYVAFGVLFMLVGLYFSLVCFGSPGLVTTCIVNVVMLGYSLSACRRPKGLSFAFWAWASGIALLLTVGSQIHPISVFPPRLSDQIILELSVLGGLVAAILWVVGLVMALQQPAGVKLAGEVSETGANR